MTDMRAGNPVPGARWDGDGVNFALFSANAEKVELCLFDAAGRSETSRHVLPERSGDVWHGYLPDLPPGTAYGYRVHGPYAPLEGHRFNHHKLLLDPYTRELRGNFEWHEAHFGFDRRDDTRDLSFDKRDNAPFMPKSVVSDATRSQTAAANKPAIPWQATSIYETHVRGFTLLHPDVPELQRGTFAGLGHASVIAYLKSLGITSVELLPVHAFIDEFFLHGKGLKNYWGYNTSSFFTPHSRYLSGNDVLEFRRMVDDFHDAGLEVILDVVYNHSCESDHLGPTLSFRGIDNASYYHLQADNRRYYVNDTGCGNTLNINHPQVLQLVLDSLRYWSADMGVDGFRFDLATVMGRESHGFNPQADFLQAVATDPVLSCAKLIAEPWDIGPGGYQLGNFPRGWSEWNDNYRDCVRRFWRRDPGELPTLARRLHGSSDIFEHSGRPPSASINFITSHDGFTLRDLVSYQQRHNAANGEKNRDGHGENLSENFGIEGPSDDPAITAMRRRQQRNLLATLIVSQGVPMLLAGDEIGRTQGGNNNAYCQDNATNWVDWTGADQHAQNLRTFVSLLLKLRRDYPVISHNDYIHPPFAPDSVKVRWLDRDGRQVREEHWQQSHNFFLGYLLSAPGDSNAPVSVLVIFNNDAETADFRLPHTHTESDTALKCWRWLADTSSETGLPAVLDIEGGAILPIEGRSVAILGSHETMFVNGDKN